MSHGVLCEPGRSLSVAQQTAGILNPGTSEPPVPCCICHHFKISEDLQPPAHPIDTECHLKLLPMLLVTAIPLPEHWLAQHTDSACMTRKTSVLTEIWRSTSGYSIPTHTGPD